MTGDVTDADAVLRAAEGSDSAIHCAALLGGASQNMADFEAVNIGGTRNVLDAAEKLDLGRSWRSARGPSSTRRGASTARTLR